MKDPTSSYITASIILRIILPLKLHHCVKARVFSGGGVHLLGKHLLRHSVTQQGRFFMVMADCTVLVFLTMWRHPHFLQFELRSTCKFLFHEKGGPKHLVSE